MPFTPSSPARLYASRTSRNPLHTGSVATAATGGTAEAERTPDSEAETHMMTSIQYNMPVSTSYEEGPISSRDTKGDTEQRHSVSHSLRGRLTVLERPLSIQEALALSALNEDSLTCKSESPNITPQASALFDNVSESEYSMEEDMAPIVGRASSVRVSKPQIVENRPMKMPKTQEQQAGRSRSSSHSSMRAGWDPRNHTSTLLKTLEETSPQDPTWTIRSVQAEHAEEAQAWLPAQTSYRGSHPLPAPTKLREYNPDSEHDLSAEELALHTGNTLYSLHPTIVGPETPSFASIDKSSLIPMQTPANTASATLMSPAKSLSRRVTIRPADLVTKNHHDHFTFRESVVTTPYPSRASGEDNSMNTVRNDDGTKAERHSKRLDDKKRTSYPYSPGRRDRFPSPERPERLFLVLKLQVGPGAQAVIEVEIADRTTFDDEALFKQIRAVYEQQLLSRTQKAFRLIRKISHITATGISQLTNRHYPTFDSANFLKHLHNPQVGRKRKIWLLWLRNHNNDIGSHRPSTNVPQVRHINNLTRLSTRARSAPHSRQVSAGTRQPQADQDITNTDLNEEKRLSTASDTSSFHFSYSPAIPKLPFLSTRHDNKGLESHSTAKEEASQITYLHSPCHSFFWPSIHSHNHTPTTASIRKHKHKQKHDTPTADTESQAQRPTLPTLTLHYSFRTTTIIILTLLNLLFAITCTVIWVIFGVPGTRPGGDHETQIGVGGGREVTVKSDWRVNSQGRVATGVVIGFVVFLFGLAGEGMLLWMGRIVL